MKTLGNIVKGTLKVIFGTFILGMVLVYIGAAFEEKPGGGPRKGVLTQMYEATQDKSTIKPEKKVEKKKAVKPTKELIRVEYAFLAYDNQKGRMDALYRGVTDEDLRSSSILRKKYIKDLRKLQYLETNVKIAVRNAEAAAAK